MVGNVLELGNSGISTPAAIDVTKCIPRRVSTAPAIMIAKVTI